MKDLFAFRDQEITDQNEIVRKHALTVMETIDTAIELLKDNADIETLAFRISYLVFLTSFRVGVDGMGSGPQKRQDFGVSL